MQQSKLKGKMKGKKEGNSSKKDIISKAKMKPTREKNITIFRIRSMQHQKSITTRD